ncbi:hypothetical protein TNIN_384951 [Trichonephila inaurata madagascariensis]|uniref:Uncharacterized protein n=1 Tax=Trichonephila inaurata madagascariensis TaxID=2747483 RepID=A0A8X6YFG3_9ARAC|nr:hypothetical protein TNIN_384951 [Trichonephila inaurata madagascariensis]
MRGLFIINNSWHSPSSRSGATPEIELKTLSLIADKGPRSLVMCLAAVQIPGLGKDFPPAEENWPGLLPKQMWLSPKCFSSPQQT